MAENEPLEIFDLDESLGDAEKPPELPNGTYLAEVQDVQDATSAAGNPYWAVRFRVPPAECPPGDRRGVRGRRDPHLLAADEAEEG